MSAPAFGPGIVKATAADGVYIVSELDDARTMVCTVQGRAKADLIAAAPDLYAALDDLIEVCRPNIYPQPDKPDSAWAKLEAARLAILKARGAA